MKNRIYIFVVGMMQGILNKTVSYNQNHTCSDRNLNKKRTNTSAGFLMRQCKYLIKTMLENREVKFNYIWEIAPTQIIKIYKTIHTATKNKFSPVGLIHINI